MLSIRLDEKHEWWVSGRAFERLFQSALESGQLPPNLRTWLDVAFANGGFSLSRMEVADAERLISALSRTAQQEVDALANANPASEDGGYKSGLMRLLDLVRDINRET